jgi:CRISPR-associated protein Cas2
MPRTTYIVTYDICDPKRLRKVFRTCRDYGNHLQYSVFECDLNPAEKVQLERKLKEIINGNEDQVLFITLGAAEARGERDITALGKAYARIDTACYVA